MCGMRILFIGLLVAGAAVSGCGSAPAPPPFKAVADNKLLMQSVIDPNADLVWDAVKTIVTRDKTEEIRPHTTDEWLAIRNAAVALTESGNLLMMAPRAKDGDVWMKRSQEMIDAGLAAWKAAEAKNVDQLFTIGGDIYEACSHCHQEYMDAIKNANQ
jgi:hypothetical protein